MRAIPSSALRPAIAALLAATISGCGVGAAPREPDAGHGKQLSPQMIAEGQRIFRFDTFGDEQLWTDQLAMHTVVETSVDPLTALAVGLKVDSAALPEGFLGSEDLGDPATTVKLLQHDAVVGIKATVTEYGHIEQLGITCALCHSTVDNSGGEGIGRRLDGWPNRDLNVGAIIALSPNIPEQVKNDVYRRWGPGKYDPRFNIDGFNTPLVLPPAYGLHHVKNETYTGDGPISYWNAYVAVTQMGGQGNFSDPRLGIDVSFSPDLVTSKLPALRAYQLSLETPAPPPGSFDKEAATRGRVVFNQACIGCHVGGSGTDNNSGKLHAPEETGMDGAYAARTVNKAYRTTPLRGLWQHPPYFHDGSAESLEAVILHYNREDVLNLGLTVDQREDLEEYLKSL